MASKYIDYGDALFAKQKYVEANDRYRKAARSTPQLAVTWFRQGFALAAIGRCDQAAAAIKRGLKLDPAWPKSNFILDRLFGGNAAAKNACLDAVAAAVKEKPADSDRLFLLGVVLHFDGQDNRAAAAFARAEQTAGNNIGHIEAFMDEKEVVPADFTSQTPAGVWKAGSANAARWNCAFGSRGSPTDSTSRRSPSS